MCKVIGYCRISTVKQSIERQIRNIKEQYPDAVIVSEAYTGTKMDRPQWSKVMAQVKAGKVQKIVFDSVSRMSRNAAEGFELYKELYSAGVDLVFLKEPYINTQVFKSKTEQHIAALTQSTGSAATDKMINTFIQALNDWNMDIVQEQIQLAFEQAQKEVDDLHQRTREGIETARLNGKQIGQKQGAKLHVKKADAAKEVIRQHSKDFGGTLSDAEVIKLAGISRNTYYKYKAELKAE